MARDDIRGFIRTSLLDWDGKIVSVLYLPGCNFRCPFCHNAGLVLQPGNMEPVEWDVVEDYLSKNGDFIDGICITGGEPTLHRFLPGLIRKIKDMGLKIKIDTNGTNPSMLERLIKEGLVDYVSMDVKSSLETYDECAGARVDIEKVKRSIRILLRGKVDYEFRTTILPRFHGKEEMRSIGLMIEGAERYVLQQFVPKNTLEPEFLTERAYSAEEMRALAREVEPFVKKVDVRGV